MQYLLALLGGHLLAGLLPLRLPALLLTLPLQTQLDHHLGRLHLWLLLGLLDGFSWVDLYLIRTEVTLLQPYEIVLNRILVAVFAGAEVFASRTSEFIGLLHS